MRNGRSRYRSLFTSRRRRRGATIGKVIAGIVVLGAVVFLGYSIADPLMALLSGKLTQNTSSAQSSSQAGSSAPSSSGAPSSSTPAESSSAIRGVYLPKKYLSDTNALNDFIAQAKDAGINLAVIDLKGEDGVVNYKTSIEEVQDTEIAAENAPDAAAAAKALSAAGITPAARICAFKDPLAPSVMRGSGVMYAGDHTLNWLDPTNSRWLNPYSQIAQQYIEDLAAEAVSLGYEQVFVDYLTFPTVGNPDKSGYYGENMPSKELVIADFVDKLHQRVNAAGGKLTVMTTGAAAIGQPAENCGQTADIFSLPCDYISPNLCPSLLNKNGVTIGSSQISKPDLTPGDTVRAIAQYLKDNNGDKVSTALPFIQAYTNTALGSGNYKEYTSEDIKAQIQALQGAGINGYVLYNPDADYDFSALK